jgi:hypothetical protein
MAYAKKKPSRPGPFVGPKMGGKPSFPIGDAKHARLAIGGATRSQRAGNITPAQAASIKAKARAKLKSGKAKK